MGKRSAYMRKTGWSARFAAALAVLFVLAQLATTAHAATYGDADHVHDGLPCIVASLVKKTDDLNVAGTAPTLEARDTVRAENDADLVSETGRSDTFRPIRGPPLLG